MRRRWQAALANAIERRLLDGAGAPAARRRAQGASRSSAWPATSSAFYDDVATVS